MRLGGETRPVAYPVPMILAARMGPTPKIWVRVVPEASTSASMRRFRSAIFLSSALTSRNTSEAKRRLRRAEVPLGRSALGPNASQEAPGPVGRELPHHPAGEGVPQERVETVERPGALCDQVLSPL